MSESSVRIFVSYSHRDEEHRDRLLTHLKLMARQELIEPWDDRQIAPAEEWEPAIEEHLEAADLILLLVTADFMASDYCWGKELERAMERFHAGEARVLPIFVDHCDWKGAPFGKLQGVPKDSVPVTAYENQEEAWTEVAKAIRRVIGGPSVKSTPPPKPPAPKVRWTDELRIYGRGFAGRRAELELLDRAVAQGKVRVLSLWAEGGAGKTRLLVQWLNRVRDNQWRGLDCVFVHSFYSQGSSDERSASSETFFAQALKHFSYTGPLIKDPTEKGRCLAGLVTAARGLLVLDGMEPLQYPARDARKGELKDTALRALLLTLANAPAGLCLVTTRQELPELRERVGVAVQQQSLDRLNADDGAALLRELEIKGPDRELRQAVEDYHGHAYSLMLLGTYLRDATDDHDIRRRGEMPLLVEDEEHDNHAQHMFEAYERRLGSDSPEVATLRLLGFFDRPAQRELIEKLRAAEADDLRNIVRPLTELQPTQWQRVLTRLQDLRLLSVAGDGSLDSHALLREHFAAQLRKRFPDAYRAGHKRLYEHLCATTTEGEKPTLEDLQPLYQAVAHGCHAGLQQEACDKVYFARITRGRERYAVMKLGAFGSDLGGVACFFETPWSRVSPALMEGDQAWLLNQAAFRLRALGRLTEALEPMRAGIEGAVKLEDWKNAAIYSSNLSELELTLGEVAGAVDDAKQSVTYADRSGDWGQRMTKRTTHADALHQAGRRDEAEALFREAEEMQAKNQPKYPLLYSLQGFQYCDLLLTEAERATWQLTLDSSLTPHPSSAPTSWCAVEQRAAKMFEWRLPSDSLLDIALDHLTLGRTALYRAILEKSAIRNAKLAVEMPVDGLRRAGAEEFLVRGLLARAWLRFLERDPAASARDLDEAWEIAERGPMKLHMADIHLYRARLFGGKKDEGGSMKYPWDSPQADLDEAARLIGETGYHRRDEELADATEAAKGW